MRVGRSAPRARGMKGRRRSARSGRLPGTGQQERENRRHEESGHEAWADATFATDPVGAAMLPPVLRAPNGSVQDSRRYWAAGRPLYDPADVIAPVLLAVGEWDHATPPAMAQALFARLVNAPSKRLVMIGE